MKKRELELSIAIKKELERLKQARGELTPDELRLLRQEMPSPGLHTHDEDNPFGLHSHFIEDSVDGAHVHTPQNPMGEHVHGEFEGMALIDGAHSHEHDSFGGHFHEEDYQDSDNLPITEPDQEIE